MLCLQEVTAYNLKWLIMYNVTLGLLHVGVLIRMCSTIWGLYARAPDFCELLNRTEQGPGK